MTFMMPQAIGQAYCITRLGFARMLDRFLPRGIVCDARASRIEHCFGLLYYHF